MALIFAFQDESGRWHGTPDAELDGPVREDVLTLTPDSLNGEVRPSPFAGQRLVVRCASIEEGPGYGDYLRLDGGKQLFATYTVDQLLFPQLRVAGQPPPGTVELPQ